MRSGPFRRQVQQAGHNEPRLALKQNLFHPEPVAAQFADHAGVEWRAFREAAKRFDKARAQSTLVSGDRVGRGEPLVTFPSARQRGLGLASQMIAQGAFAFPCCRTGGQYV